jgi:hypothetical protein
LSVHSQPSHVACVSCFPTVPGPGMSSTSCVVTDSSHMTNLTIIYNSYPEEDPPRPVLGTTSIRERTY